MEEKACENEEKDQNKTTKDDNNYNNKSRNN